jgi:dolichol-phosphate mannosyltransferase
VNTLNFFGNSVDYFQLAETASKNRYVWLVVVRNEGQTFVNQIEKMSMIKSVDLDIMVIDGGSTDGSVEVGHLKSIGVDSLLVSHAKEGFSHDLQIGLIHAMRRGYVGVVTVDGNGKDSLESVNQFILALEQGFDFIQGSRFKKGGGHENTPFMRLFGIRFLAAPITSFFSKKRITDPTNGFRGYSRNLLLNSKLGLGRNIYLGYNLVSYIPICAGKEKLTMKEIPVFRKYPRFGKVPTKIVSPSQWIQIFFDLFRSGFRKFDEYPPQFSESLI